MIHVGYVSGDIPEKNIYTFFGNIRHLHYPHDLSEKAIYCLYLHLSCNELIKIDRKIYITKK